MKKILSVLIGLIFIMLSFFGCSSKKTEFTGFIVGHYKDYVSVSTLDDRVDFYDCNIDVTDIDFKAVTGRSVKIVIKSRSLDDFNVVKIVPESIELIKYKYKNISLSSGNELIKKGATVVDCRSQDEYKLGHIKGARCLPPEKLEKFYKVVLKNKQDPIVLYSDNAKRSELCAKYLISFGYKKVYNMGSIKNWNYSQLETE